MDGYLLREQKSILSRQTTLWLQNLYVAESPNSGEELGIILLQFFLFQNFSPPPFRLPQLLHA